MAERAQEKDGERIHTETQRVTEREVQVQDNNGK